VPKKSTSTDPIHEQLLLLDRLEELREDMEELGINSMEELRQRIVELEALLDDDDFDEGDDGSV